MFQLVSKTNKFNLFATTDEITPSEYQTKIWRKNQEWYINGKKNECEKYQIRIMSNIFGELIHTHERVNLITGGIYCVKYPFKRKDAFEWTENFDRKTIHKGETVYFNFKFVSGSGGVQTRTLREVYHYIKKQQGHIFVNILDGDESHKKYKYFRSLMTIKKYVGDTYNFPTWYGITFVLNFSDDIKKIIMSMCF